MTGRPTTELTDGGRPLLETVTPRFVRFIALFAGHARSGEDAGTNDNVKAGPIPAPDEDATPQAGLSPELQPEPESGCRPQFAGPEQVSTHAPLLKHQWCAHAGTP